ncbi:MAG TPA: SDR family oxidoreductase [Pseudolabrys sp.]|jgi:3-oxoacyl-[acyl-carrier protein] reductase|nr:SDR family oxidoreductase [Pseudolabrys sp.]
MFRNCSLAGKVAVVTGAGGGIGRAVANALAAEECRLVLSDYEKGLLEQTAAAIKTPVVYIKADVAKKSDAEAVFALADREYGQVDILVTCAGTMSTQRILEMTEVEWDRTFSINTKGTFFFVQQALMRMLPRKSGRIVAIASDTAKRGGGRTATSAYAASKAAVVTLVKSVAREIGGSGVAINSICPGPTDTPMHSALSADAKAKAAATLPLARFAQPHEIANAVVFLASDAASFVYGESFNVDGGVLME